RVTLDGRRPAKLFAALVEVASTKSPTRTAESAQPARGGLAAMVLGEASVMPFIAFACLADATLCDKPYDQSGGYAERLHAGTRDSYTLGCPRMPTYPYTIDNGHGEQLTFTGVTREPDGD